MLVGVNEDLYEEGLTRRVPKGCGETTGGDESVRQRLKPPLIWRLTARPSRALPELRGLRNSLQLDRAATAEHNLRHILGRPAASCAAQKLISLPAF